MNTQSKTTFRLRGLAGLGAFALAAAALTACGSSSDEAAATGADAAEIATLAGEEKALSVYSALADGTNEALVKAFNAKHPEIKIQVTRLISSDLSSRFASETQSGAPSADLLLMTDSVMYDRDEQWFASLSKETIPNLANIPADYTDEQWFSAIVSPYVATYNSDLVKTPPTTWEQLVDSPYIDKATLADPKTSDAVNGFWQALGDAYGDEFLTELGEKNKSWYASASTSVQTVAAGQYHLSSPSGQFHSRELRASGAPISYVIPTPAIGFAANVAVAKEATNPNAALLFADFLLTEEGQNAYCGDDQEGMSILPTTAPKCTEAPADFTVVDPERAGQNRDKILGAFGLSE